MEKIKLQEENEFLESMLKSLDDVKKGRIKEWKFKNPQDKNPKQFLMSSEDTITLKEARERLSNKYPNNKRSLSRYVQKGLGRGQVPCIYR